MPSRASGRLRVGLVTLVDLSGTSGQSVFARELATALSRRAEVELAIICPRPRGAVADLLDSRSVHVEYLPPKVSRSIAWHLWVQPRLLRAIHRLRASTGGLDLVVASSRPGIVLLPLVCTWLGVPQVLFKEGSLDRGNARRITRLPGLRAAAQLSTLLNARASERVFAFSLAARDEVARVPGVPAGRVTFVHHPVRPELFTRTEGASVRDELPLSVPDGSWTIGFVGSFKWYHCVDRLLGAVALMEDPDVRILLAGEGPELEAVRRLVAHLGLASRVIMVGHVDHERVGSFMSACDVLYGVIHPDRSDNPMKVYEYLASGRPVVAHRTPELTFIDRIDAGRLVVDPEPKTIAGALQDLRERDASELDAMGRRGREYILSNHTWDALIGDVLSSIPVRESPR